MAGKYFSGNLSALDAENNRERRMSEWQRSMSMPTDVGRLVREAMVADPKNTVGMQTRAEAMLSERPRTRAAEQAVMRGLVDVYSADAARREQEKQRSLAVQERRRQEAASNPLGTGMVNGKSVMIPEYGQGAVYRSAMGKLTEEAAKRGIDHTGIDGGYVTPQSRFLDVMRDINTYDANAANAATKKQRDFEIEKETAGAREKWRLENLKTIQGDTKEAAKLRREIDKWSTSQYKNHVNEIKNSLYGTYMVPGKTKDGKPDPFNTISARKPLPQEEQQQILIAKGYDLADFEFKDGAYQPLSAEKYRQSPQYLEIYNSQYPGVDYDSLGGKRSAPSGGGVINGILGGLGGFAGMLSQALLGGGGGAAPQPQRVASQLAAQTPTTAQAAPVAPPKASQVAMPNVGATMVPNVGGAISSAVQAPSLDAWTTQVAAQQAPPAAPPAAQAQQAPAILPEVLAPGKQAVLAWIEQREQHRAAQQQRQQQEALDTEAAEVAGRYTTGQLMEFLRSPKASPEAKEIAKRALVLRRTL